MRRLLFALLLSSMLWTPAFAGKRVALVIGNSKYQNVTALTNPANDAAVMEAALKGAGFDVIKYTDLDQRGMKQAMLEFGRKLKQGAEASMFFYAGHGIEVDGRNYLVPTDSNTESKEEADIQNVEVNDFLALMENSGVPLNIVVLDACRNNPFRGLRAIGGGLAPVRAPVGTFVAYSTAPGSVAADGTGNNSPFTLALAETMKVPGLPLESVFKQTRSKVRVSTGGQQVPFDSSAIEGDFYFSPAEAATPGTVETPPPVKEQVEVTPKTPPPAEVGQSEAEAAFLAAGADPQQLRVVEQQYRETVWGKLAGAKLRVADEKLALATPKVPTVETPVEPVVNTPPPTEESGDIKVAADGSGDYTSIAKAVAAAKTGDKIVIAPGDYKGNVVVTKAIELIGPSDPGQMKWTAKGDHVLVWQAQGGRIANMTMHQQDGCKLACDAIFFDGGSARAENNFLSSDGGAAVYVSGAKAKPDIVHNTISKSAESGIYIEAGASGTIDNNDIFENAYAGIEIKSGANPVVTNNLIRDGKSSGMFLNDGALGTIESNDISGNAFAGIETKSSRKFTIRSNKIHGGKEGGLWVQNSAKGIIDNNDIRDNKYSGIEISAGGNAVFTNNIVTGNGENGVYVHDKGSATLTDNDLTGNKNGAWSIADNAGKLKRSGNKE
jgi:parallel beta-helix repeat protein